MASMLTSRYNAMETLSALTSVTATLEGKHLDNPFLTLLHSSLSTAAEELRASISFHDQESLAAESDHVDTKFNESFKKLRTMVETMSEMHEFGEQATHCATVRDLINRHDRNLHRLPKDEQITLFDSLMTELNDELIEKAQIRPLTVQVVQHHQELKSIEENKKASAVSKEGIESPSKLSAAAKPKLNALMNHIADFADLGSDPYKETLTELHADLAPIVTRVKTRTTRMENASEEEVAE